MDRREKEVGEKMKASLEAFYNNQFRRDEEVLTILKERKLRWRVTCYKRFKPSSTCIRSNSRSLES